MITCRSSIAGLLVLVAGLSVAGAASADALTVNKTGSGSGTVTGNGGAINCGAICDANFPANTPIMLTASPTAGHQFTGWLGPCTGTSTCQFAINGAATVSATFAAVPIAAPILDSDGDTALGPLTDGLLIVRYLFGLTSASWTAGATGPNASRDSGGEVLAYLDDVRPYLDIDGNGRADPLTDGLLAIRYLFGLRGEALINDVIGIGATRDTALAIEGALESVLPGGGLPPDPGAVAPATDPSVATLLVDATAFLYSGAAPIQTGVAPGTIEARRVAVLRGTVRLRGGAALPGVTISILSHPELGQTLSRADGAFDLVVNGGGALTVNYQKTGFLPVQRQLQVPWQDFIAVPDVAMIPLDAAVTTIGLNAGEMQVARGTAMTDADGTRRATLLVPAGTTANIVMPNGSTQPIGTINVRATEYTVGADGPQAMPGVLPPNSGYTYAVELSADEAIAAGATRVSFSTPLPYYIENFLAFPVGGAVPTGYYDRTRAAWIPSPNGRVIKITSITGGVATVDTVGSAMPALAPITLSVAERTQLASLYAVGQELWRVPIPHFTPWDHNWGYGPPDDAEPPDVPPPRDTDEIDDPVCSSGSIIECENQTLGERIPIVGTPHTLNYRSTRVPGRKSARGLEIDISGPSVAGSPKRIELEVQVAGRTFKQDFPTTPNQKTTFLWDGQDAYGRTMQGAQPASISIANVYQAVYLSPAQLQTSFAAFGGNAVGPSASRVDAKLTTRFKSTIGSFDMRAVGLGGWTLASHHVYDVAKQVLYQGDGTRRTAKRLGNVVEEVFQPSDARDVAVAPDGGVYISSIFGESVVYRVAPDGTFSVVIGNGKPGGSIFLSSPNRIALGPDGSLYIAETFAHRIRRITPGNAVSIVAGTGTAGFGGDGGLATAATLSAPQGLAVAPDGSIYISDTDNHRIRRIRTDGFINTIAGAGGATCTVGNSCGDGGQAIQAGLNYPRGIAFGPDGSLYLAETNTNKVRRIDTKGIITTVAGSGGHGFSGDGGPATAATFRLVFDVDVAPDGGLYIADHGNGSVRYVGTDGIINTVAGTGTEVTGVAFQGQPPASVTFGLVDAVTVGPDGRIYFADNGNSRVLRITPALPGLSLVDIVVPSADGRLLYLFDSNGRHLSTLDSRTGAPLLQFGYDASGRLNQVTEKTGGTDNVTTINHDVNGNPTAIVGPYGQQTLLGVDANGFLASVTNPASEQIQLVSNADGLLTSITDPRGKPTTFGYDSVGRLESDNDAGGGAQALVRTPIANGFTVARTTGLGRVTTHKVENLPDRIVQRTVTAPDATQAVSQQSVEAGTTTATDADGTVSSLTRGPDPRFGMAAAVTTALSVALPAGGPALAATRVQTAELTSEDDPLSMISMTDASTIAGRTTTTTYTASTKTRTKTTPAGRTSSMTIDTFGRPVQAQVNGLDQATLLYDTRGRLASLTRGTGPGARTWSFAYNGQGFLQTVTDPLTRTAQFAYDAAGRATSKARPGGQLASFSYDAAGNITSLTPPGRPAHGFEWSNRNQLTLLTPPAVPGGGPTSYAYNADRQLTSVSRPDGRSITLDYAANGRLATRTLAASGVPTGADTWSYDSAGRVASIAAANGVTTTYAYLGSRIAGATWSGAVSGNVTRTYDTSHRTASQSVNGANTIALTYDNDSLLIGAGALTITRNAQHGLATGSSLGNIATTIGVNGFGEIVSYGASASGNGFYSHSVVRNAIGRLTQRTETIGGVTDIYDYAYDTSGQLTGVNRNSVPVETYGYDNNGNRTSATVSGNSVVATYDNQDRLTQYGAATFVYNGAGDLVSKTVGAQVTQYQYDQLGNLLGVTLPNGTPVTYVVDGNGRRVGKKVNGTFVRKFLYGDRLRPVAQLDAADALVSRFVFAGGTVPVYMIKAGATLRIITDQLGSVRLVVDSATGAIVQRIDYDSFGNVTLDTNPGFQPFGFAGGLYDPDTGLTRFGSRDYDPASGRWTTKDTIGFAGRDTNLYRYARNNPVNFSDPTGAADTSGLDQLNLGNQWTVQELIEQIGSNAGFQDLVESPLSGIPIAGTTRNWLMYVAAVFWVEAIFGENRLHVQNAYSKSLVCTGIAEAALAIARELSAAGGFPGVTFDAISRETQPGREGSTPHDALLVRFPDGQSVVLDWHETLSPYDPAIQTQQTF